MRIKNDDNIILLGTCFIVIILILLFASCKPRIQYVPIETATTEIEILRDTVVVHKLDIIRDTVMVSDTISYLENKYSYSWAKWSNGILHHSLGIKNTPIPISIQYVDKIREVVKEVPIEVEVVKWENKPYSWIEKLLLFLGVSSLVYWGVILINRFK